MIAKINNAKSNKILIFLVLLYSGFLVSAQGTGAKVENHLIKANLLFFPSITYEYGLSDHWALKAEIGTALTVFETFGNTEVAIFPKLEGQVKYFYNLEKRLAKNRNISSNSGNFVAAVGQFQDEKSLFSDVDRTGEFQMLGAVWGLQRTYGKSFSLLFEIGGGYDFGFRDFGVDNGRPFPLIGFELGWVLFKE